MARRRLPPQGEQEPGIEQVELALDGQRPGMQQRLQCQVIGVEIVARDLLEQDVRREHGRRRLGLRQEAHVLGQEHEEEGGAAGEQHDGERGEDPPDAPLVEGREREAAARELAPHDGGDEEAGEDVEHVDADEAAANAGEAVMEQDHDRDRDGAQPVEIGPVAAGMARLRARRREEASGAIVHRVGGLRLRTGWPGRDRCRSAATDGNAQPPVVFAARGGSDAIPPRSVSRQWSWRFRPDTVKRPGIETSLRSWVLSETSFR